MNRRAFIQTAAITAFAGGSRLSAAQQKMLHMIIPFAAGGITDSITRMIAPSIEKAMGRTAVIEAKPGASGLIAANFVQNARAADTITLMVQSIGFVGLPYLNKAAKFDPLKDFTPVCTVADGAAYVYVHGSVPAKNLRELIDYAKSQPGGVDAATSGVGGASHMWTELLARRAGVKLVPVPYKGGAEMTTAMITGETKMMISTATEALNAQVRSGKLRILAVTSAQRSSLAPDVPAIAETLPGFAVEGWYGFFAAKNTSQADVDALAAAVNGALHAPGIRERFGALYLEPRFEGPREFAASVTAGQAFYKGLVKELDITPQ